MRDTMFLVAALVVPLMIILALHIYLSRGYKPPGK